MHKNNWLLWAILIAAIAGIFCGWFFGHSMVVVEWIGELFLDALKMTIIPLIVAAVISGIASIGDASRLQRLGGLTVLYYFCTTSIAVLLGLIIVNIIQPGAGLTEVSEVIPDRVAEKKKPGS